MCCRGGTGYIGSSFSCIEILVALFYTGIMRFDSEDTRKDRFMLSKGHASPTLCCILADLGFFSEERLKKFNHKEGSFILHFPETMPGIPASIWSLGMGLGMATGMAYGRKLNRDTGLVFCLIGDAETYEGSIWEAATFASHYRLSNLVVIMDRNFMGATDFTEDMCALEDVEAKWRAFGWETARIDGHDFDELMGALKGIRSRQGAGPYIIIADTNKGKGISFMEGEPLWHSRAFTADEKAQAEQEVNCENG